MAQGFAFLVFPDALEKRFANEGAARRFTTILTAGLASVVLFGGLMFADVLLMPDIVPMGLILRIGVYLPITVAGLYAVHKLAMPWLTEWMVAAGGMFAGLLSVVMYVSSTSKWALPAVVELNIIVVFVCAFARFWPAVALSSFMAVAHAFVVSTVPDFTGVLVPNTSLLLAVTITFTLYGNYKLEHDERTAFLLELREKALDAEIIRARDRLASMATTDALTGVANRRYFDEFLGECVYRARAEGRRLSLALIDIDGFKAYNDRYGHLAGDKCLVAVARALVGCMRRPGDLVARWGGEEFAVVMIDADDEAAAAAGERLRRAVHGLGLQHLASPCAGVVSISVGLVSPAADQILSASEMVQRADAALYDAKRRGRNRVSWGTADAPAPDQGAVHAWREGASA